MDEKYDLPKKFRRMIKAMELFRPFGQELTLAQIQKLRKPFPLDFLVHWITGKPVPVHRVEDLKIPMRDGVEIPVRMYHPNEKAGLPIILNYHGGGWTLGNLQQTDTFCRKLAAGVEAIVISVDYRLAPEHKFPYAANDSYDAFLWAHENAVSLGGNPERIAVVGDSAGGNLSAVVSLMARDLNGPKIAHQSLIYPGTDGNLDYASLDKFHDAPVLTKDSVFFYRKMYKKNPNDHLHPYFSPAFAEDLSGLPPALVITAGYDPLLDDGEKYAHLLKNAGNEVEYRKFEKEVHGFISFANHSPQNAEAVKLIIDRMKKYLK